MIDALLQAVNNALLNGGLGYSAETLWVGPDGHPPPWCGDWFLSIHQGTSSSERDNCLFEKYAFSATLTARVAKVPFDKINTILQTTSAQAVARKLGFNRRAEEVRALLHMNWGVLQDANQILIDYSPDAEIVEGFAEPARFRGMDQPVLVGPEWFQALARDESDIGAAEIGLKSELRFGDCLRFQPIAMFV
jgi:hypothetical protein